MAEQGIIPLGPFRGINNIDPRQSRGFQLPQGPEDPPPFLRAAINVDLDRQGWPRRRSGQTKIMGLSDGHSGFAVGNQLYLVDGTELIRVDGRSYETAVVATGLTAGKRVSFAEHAGDVYWTNGEQKGRIRTGVNTYWGVPRPRITGLSQTPGPLLPGRYMVAVTGQMVDGTESGAYAAQVIDLTQGAIVVNVLAETPYVNLFVTDANGNTLYWAGSVAASQFPYTISETNVSTQALDVIGCTEPPPGQIVRSFRGWLLVASAHMLYFSMPVSPHLFHPSTDYQMFEDEIVMMEPLTEGVFIAVRDRTYWVEGMSPADWRPRLVDTRKVVAGPGLRLPGRKIAGLNAETVYRRVQQPANEVVMWMTEDGPAVGLPGGQVQMLFDGAVAMDKATSASMAFRELDGIRQVLMSLQHTTENRFATTDRVSCTVIKAQ